MKIFIQNIIFCGLSLIAPQLFAQTLSSNLDKKEIPLGEPLTLIINIQNLQGKEVVSAQRNGLLPFHFEEISDSIQQNTDQYTRTIEFSIFDEGTFQIPALEFKVGNEILKTIPYKITVNNPTQKGEEINDIMSNQEVKLGISEYFSLYQKYIWGGLGVLALILAFIFSKKKKSSPPKIYHSKTTFLSQLEDLRTKKFIENEDFRSFYTELLDISRRFLGQQFQIPAEILLTDDLIDFIQKTPNISPENKKILTEIFTHGDLVKFAKTIPNKTLMEQDFGKVETWIKSSLTTNNQTNA